MTDRREIVMEDVVETEGEVFGGGGGCLMIDDTFRCKKSMDDDAWLLAMAAERIPYFDQGRLLPGLVG